ncbi:NAD(P)-binding protein [Mycena polygramma]|nr:NAD(P)-binding protein [Mycena polygramma]
MSSKTVYLNAFGLVSRKENIDLYLLVSGANRGIGYGLAATLVARKNNIVFAGARDPAAQSLKDLAAKYPNVHAVKLTSGDKDDNERRDKKDGRPTRRISNYYGPLATTSPSQFRDHWEVNTLGPVVLFQAAHTLLLASPTGATTFALISTAGASMTSYLHLSASAYGSSKAAVNFLIKVLAAEHPTLIALAISPGWVATEMGNAGAVANGLPAAPVTLEDSVTGIMSRIDGATVEKTSGRFWNFKRTSGNPWDIDTDDIPS